LGEGLGTFSHIGPAEAPSPLRTSAKHAQRIARNTLGMPEEGSFAARGRDEIPPDPVLPHPVTSPSSASCSSICASALPKASPESIRADLLACVVLDDEPPQPEPVVVRTHRIDERRVSARVVVEHDEARGNSDGPAHVHDRIGSRPKALNALALHTERRSGGGGGAYPPRNGEPKLGDPRYRQGGISVEVLPRLPRRFSPPPAR
jgi:hypothetical protein